MLRVAGVRTGVEILGSEDAALVPPAGPIVGVPQEFRPVGSTQWVEHPDLWPHEILDTSNQPIGLLILCNPSSEAMARFNEVSAVLSDPDVLYLGLRPGQEHWIWFDGVLPWPDEFRLRGAEYATQLDPTVWNAASRRAYTISTFAPQPGASLMAFEKTWEILTSSQSTPAGFLLKSTTDEQQWWGRWKPLMQGLIPPGPDGTWRFRKVGQLPATLETDGVHWPIPSLGPL